MKTNKAAIVTGASKGIGYAVALKFAEHNYNVTLVGIEHADLERLKVLIQERYGTICLVCAGDLADETFMKRVVSDTVTHLGRIDVLVNNAAWRTIETMRTIDLNTWEKTLRICITSPAFLAKWTAEVMENQGIKGAVINVSSVMADRAAGTSPAYIAAKGAMDSLTRELAVTYGRSGIRVLSISPGYIDTDMSKDYTDAEGADVSSRMAAHLVGATPLERGGTTAEVAEAIYWLSSEKASFITGTSLLVDGGFKHNFNDYAIKKLQFPNEF